MDKSDETGRKVRWGVELSDGRRFEYVMEYAGDVFGRAIE